MEVEDGGASIGPNERSSWWWWTIVKASSAKKHLIENLMNSVTIWKKLCIFLFYPFPIIFTFSFNFSPFLASSSLSSQSGPPPIPSQAKLSPRRLIFTCIFALQQQEATTELGIGYWLSAAATGPSSNTGRTQLPNKRPFPLFPVHPTIHICIGPVIEPE